MLHIQNLSAHVAEQTILNDISLSVLPGEIHVIIGPNGAGKSTLGQVLLGNPKFSISNGSITFQGEDFLSLEPHERAQKGFFMTFQTPPEIDGISLKEVLFGAKKSQNPEFHSSFRFKKALLQELEHMQLSPEFLERDLNKNASGGEKKKLEIVALSTLQPTLAFLDEIDSGVDVDALESIAQRIQDFMSQEGKSIIVVSHTEKLLKRLSPTHVHVLIQGTIRKSGDANLIAEIHQKGFKHFL